MGPCRAGFEASASYSYYSPQITFHNYELLHIVFIVKRARKMKKIFYVDRALTIPVMLIDRVDLKRDENR